MRRLPIRAPAPLRRATFRQLWLGMSMSYAGDRLQQLAQAWLVATISGSALAVGGIGVFGALPLLLMPLGGVVADQVNRRRLLIVSQMVGAISTAVIALLVLTNFIAIWHIYLWAFINGLIMLVSRPAYKVVLTEAVPPAEVRSAVAINSMTETSALVLVNAGGSVLMGLLGLPPAFVLNTVTYLVAAGSLWGLPELGQLPVEHSGALSIMRLWVDLVDGISYLARKSDLLHPFC
jgi:MFS family permease